MLDVDICGPSIPKVMGLEGEQVHQSGSGWSLVVSPAIMRTPDNCKDLSNFVDHLAINILAAVNKICVTLWITYPYKL